MSENRDTAIKLFGKTIPLQRSGSGEEGGRDQEKSQDPQMEETTPKSKHQGLESPDSQEKEATTSSSGIRKPCSSDASTTKNSTAAEEQSNDASNWKEKSAKKPEKILPCPRCKSLDTKFCYYNNYNMNQPRHFCKRCQRYWTAGGTMRNVPVGAGRRKNKNTSQYSSLRALPSSPNGTVLSFGSQAPLCESCNKNGFHQEMHSTISNGDEQSKCEETSSHNSRGTTAPIPCFDGSTWSPFGVSNFPIPFYPAAAYWSCTVPPATWSVPWLSTPTLGKHSRDGNMLQNSILVPKTLRIDDPEEAAKSSIWTMVGIKSDKSSNTILKAFQPKVDIKNHVLEAPSLLHANPAALSRSLSFQGIS